MTKHNLWWVTVLSVNRIIDFGEHIAYKQISKEGLAVHPRAY